MKKPKQMNLEDLCRMQAGREYSLTWQYRNDGERSRWMRAAKKGYFRKNSARGISTFTRTNKAYIVGDSFKKPIAFSWPDPSMAPRHIRAMLIMQSTPPVSGSHPVQLCLHFEEAKAIAA